jgi:hypothetical protein
MASDDVHRTSTRLDRFSGRVTHDTTHWFSLMDRKTLTEDQKMAGRERRIDPSLTFR